MADAQATRPMELVEHEMVPDRDRKDIMSDSYQNLQNSIEGMRNAVISRTNIVLMKLRRGDYSNSVSEEENPKAILLLALIEVGATQSGWIRLALGVASGQYNF